MKKHINKILLGSILFFISFNAFSFAFLAFAPEAISAMAVASRALMVALPQATKTAVFGAVENGSVATALTATGVIGSALGGYALVSEGDYSTSSGSYSSFPTPTITYTDVTTYYCPDGISTYPDGCTVQNRNDDNIKYFSSSDGVCTSTAYIGGLSSDTLNISWRDLHSEYLVGGFYYVVPSQNNVGCRIPPSESIYDFSNPDIKTVPIYHDANGAYYNDTQNNRVPVYEASLKELSDAYQTETGSYFDFLGSLWDSLSDKPDDYQGLSASEATDRVNYYLNSNDSDVLLNVDELPHRPDYLSPNIEMKNWNPTQSVVDHFDDQGNYLNTTIDNYQQTDVITDGVVTSTNSTYKGRETIVDSTKVGTTGTGSILDSANSTYTGSDALNNSKVSENTLSNESASNTNDGLLSSIVANTSKTNQLLSNVSNSNTAIAQRVADIQDGLSISPTQPTDLDLATSVSDYDATLQSDEDFQLDIPRMEVDFDSFSVTPNVFQSAPCQNITYNLDSGVQTWDLSSFCEILHLFSLFLLAFAVYDTIPIVLRALQA